MRGNMDTHREEIWKDHVRKEEKARVKFFQEVMTNREKESRYRLPHFKKIDKFDPDLLDLPPKQTAVIKLAEELKMPPISPPTNMKPVSEETTAVLYNGVSKEGEGRYKYLLMRSKKTPEERYYYPMTSNSEYGWGLPQPNEFGPKHGRVNMIKTFYRDNNFIFPSNAGNDASA